MRATPTLQAAYDRAAAYADDLQDQILELEDFIFMMAAWRDGATIQRNIGGNWYAEDFPDWEEAFIDEYRIAPYN